MTPLTTSHWRARPLTPILGTTVGGVLGAAAWRAPDRVALIDGDRRWTYGELLAEAERVARALLTRFEPGEPVAVWAGNGPGMGHPRVRGRAGRPDAGHGQPGLPGGGARARARALRRARGVPARRRADTDPGPGAGFAAPAARGDHAGRVAGGDEGPLPEVDPGGPAQILYTSGTTGRPKAAVLTHRGLTNNARLAAGAIGLRAGMSWSTRCRTSTWRAAR